MLKVVTIKNTTWSIESQSTGKVSCVLLLLLLTIKQLYVYILHFFVSIPTFVRFQSSNMYLSVYSITYGLYEYLLCRVCYFTPSCVTLAIKLYFFSSLFLASPLCALMPVSCHSLSFILWICFLFVSCYLMCFYNSILDRISENPHCRGANHTIINIFIILW